MFRLRREWIAALKIGEIYWVRLQNPMAIASTMTGNAMVEKHPVSPIKQPSSKKLKHPDEFFFESESVWCELKPVGLLHFGQRWAPERKFVSQNRHFSWSSQRRPEVLGFNLSWPRQDDGGGWPAMAGAVEPQIRQYQ
jgi:hypothetical protein